MDHVYSLKDVLSEVNATLSTLLNKSTKFISTNKDEKHYLYIDGIKTEFFLTENAIRHMNIHYSERWLVAVHLAEALHWQITALERMENVEND